SRENQNGFDDRPASVEGLERLLVTLAQDPKHDLRVIGQPVEKEKIAAPMPRAHPGDKLEFNDRMIFHALQSAITVGGQVGKVGLRMMDFIMPDHPKPCRKAEDQKSKGSDGVF